jgi:hypothetical protein
MKSRLHLQAVAIPAVSFARVSWQPQLIGSRTATWRLEPLLQLPTRSLQLFLSGSSVPLYTFVIPYLTDPNSRRLPAKVSEDYPAYAHSTKVVAVSHSWLPRVLVHSFFYLALTSSSKHKFTYRRKYGVRNRRVPASYGIHASLGMVAPLLHRVASCSGNVADIPRCTRLHS